MNRKYLGSGFALIVILISAAYFNSYYSNYDYSLRRRADIANQNKADIHVAAVWNLLQDKSFIDGARLAVKEINVQGIALKSGNKSTIGRIVLHEFDDGTEEAAEDTKRSIAADRRIVAAIGHSSSSTAIPASISYEYNGVLFISVVATDSALTAHNFKYTFSIIPSDKYFAGKLVEYAKQHNLLKLVILYAREDYGIRFYEEFTGQLDNSFEIVTARSFYSTQEDIINGNINSKDVIYQFMRHYFDAVILSAKDKQGSEMIEVLRSMGVTQPILGGDGLENRTLWNISQQASNSTYLASIFAENDESAKNMLQSASFINFIKDFKNTYGYNPGYFAFQGYEAAKVLASAYQITGSTVPIRVGSTLRFHYQHGYNNYSFDVNGMVVNKTIFIKEMRNGKLKMVDLGASQ